MASGDDEKRKAIVLEIEAWRRSKLLPEHYCDFLINLYLDDLNERPKGMVGNAVRKIGQASGKHWLLTFGIFTLICIVVLHFSAFPLALQIGLTGVVTAAFIGFAGKIQELSPTRSMMLAGTGCFFLLGTGYSICQLHGWTSPLGYILLLVVCAVVWIVSGIALNAFILHGLGWILAIAAYTKLLADHVAHPTWLEVQIFWLPAALLFGWLSWFVHNRYQSSGAVLFAVALVLWFMPEVYSALYGINKDWLQIELLCKVVIVGAGMFRLRKQWMEWVA
ncbi:hypothetical protein [Cohnella panacarvi]|uniref:hypothetical protein n=1 Tax=Cohnella panacarvi TaxID=400776 RepID=UPI00047D131B|nr:hypothetical protein [Cohnella panacarvi]